MRHILPVVRQEQKGNNIGCKWSFLRSTQQGQIWEEHLGQSFISSSLFCPQTVNAHAYAYIPIVYIEKTDSSQERFSSMLFFSPAIQVMMRDTVHSNSDGIVLFLLLQLEIHIFRIHYCRYLLNIILVVVVVVVISVMMLATIIPREKRMFQTLSIVFFVDTEQLHIG